MHGSSNKTHVLLKYVCTIIKNETPLVVSILVHDVRGQVRVCAKEKKRGARGACVCSVRKLSRARAEAERGRGILRRQ